MTTLVWVPPASHSSLHTWLLICTAFSDAGQKSLNSLLKAHTFHKQFQIKLENSLTWKASKQTKPHKSPWTSSILRKNDPVLDCGKIKQWYPQGLEGFQRD